MRKADLTHVIERNSTNAVPRFGALVFGLLTAALIAVLAFGTGGTASAQFGSNLAEGRSTTQSSTAFGGVSSRAVDGTTNGMYSQGSVTHSQSESQPWWEVDLGSVQSLGDIAIWNRTNCCPTRLTNFHVFVSNSPFTSTSVAGSQNQAGVTDIFFAGTAGQMEALTLGRSGRYVRVQLSGSGFLSLAEVEIFEDAGSATNVAEGKPASQSSNRFGGVPGRAVDGNTSGVWSEGSVTHTTNQSQPWWEVDLGSAHTLDSINLWNRTDCCSSRLQNFHVFVSPAPFTSNTVAGTQSQAGVTHIEFNGTAGVLESLPINEMGQYVRVQLDGTGWLALAEVQLWGEEAPADTTPPTASIIVPAQNSAIPANTVAISGSAQDNRGVKGVGMNIRNTATNQYLQPDGSFASQASWFKSSLTSQFEQTTNWSLQVNLPIGDYEIRGGASDASGNFSSLFTRAFAVSDGQAPTRPTSLVTIDATSSTLTLSWNPATDNIGVATYHLYRNGEFVGASSDPVAGFRDQHLDPNTGYNYRVSAVDAAGNESALSSPVFSTTLTHEHLLLSEVADTTWQVDGVLHTILPVGDVIYIGGDFTGLYSDGASRNRSNLAALDRLTGEPLSFKPDMNDVVHALETSPDGQTLYVGGSFTLVGAASRTNLAVFDLDSGSLLNPALPLPNSSVRAIASDGETLYVGGTFSKVGTENRDRIAAYDIATETLTDWAPSADNKVNDFIIDPDKIWVAGNFEAVNGLPAVGLVAINRDTGATIPTQYPAFPVIDAAAQGDQLFLAGAGPGGRVAAWDRTNGTQQWIFSTDGNVQAVTVVGDFAYFGGHYPNLENIAVGRMTRHDVVTGALDTNWLPDVNGVRSVNTLASDDDNIYAGGDFTQITGENQAGYAQFSRKTADDVPPQLLGTSMFDTDQNGYVDTVEVLFDKTLAACAAPCLTGWSVVNVPSDGTLSSVTVSGETATLNFAEGPSDPDTGVNSFKIALDDTSGIRDTGGRHAEFPLVAPSDLAAGMPIEIRRTNVGSGGLAESGDVLTVKWTEQIPDTSLPAFVDVVLKDRADGNNDDLTVAGFIAGVMDLGSDDFIVCATTPCNGVKTVTFTNSAVTFRSGGRLVDVTLGGCTGNCSLLSNAPATTVTYTPAATIVDEGNNAPIGTVTKTFIVF